MTKNKPRPSIQIEGLPPIHSPEAEKSVLGAMLNGGEPLDRALELLAEDDFFLPAHQILFRGMAAMRNKAIPVDIATLYQWLEDHKLADAAGGPGHLGILAAGTLSTLTLDAHAKTVKDRALLRRTVEAAARTIHDCHERTHEPEEVLAEAEQRIMAVGDRRVVAEIVEPEAVLRKTVQQIWDARETGTGLRGPSTGMPELDRLVHGLEPGCMSVVAARTSVGKSSFGLTLWRALGKASEPAGYFSLEMPETQCMRRVLSMETDIPLTALTEGRITPEQDDVLVLAYGRMEKWPMPIARKRGATLAQVQAIARRMVRRQGIRVLIVDYLQKIRVPGEREKRLEVAAASEGMACLAAESNIHVMCLAQLGRDVEKEERTPRLSDLKESGDIEQDADWVGLLHRPPLENKEDLSLFGKLIIAKQRDGKRGSIPMIISHRTTAWDVDKKAMSEWSAAK